ncbi:aspartyl-phosphate phosphatase Spo0E family protein [Gracilibacillus alcaliphilus]|uniref:aspartyl-phosphate phosphatase Spo0E family protein n=1 Tax=Gracilibacillus alcaliphilus TaxID=1401441 RepID=UPI003083F5A7|nr:stage 0 sporulation regulatory protein [Gracilibacillus alcaliphilus]
MNIEQQYPTIIGGLMFMTVYLNNLVNEIERLRKEMSEVALQKGITSKESLAISQKLDKLLNDYELNKQKESKHVDSSEETT